MLGWSRVLDTDDECKPLQTLFWKNNHGEYRNTGNQTWPDKLEEKAQPWALVAGLTPGGAVGTGIFSLSVGFKKSKIEQELMNWEGSRGPGGHPLPPLKNVWLTS